MTQIKESKHFKQELRQAGSTWWTQAATKVIEEAGLQEKLQAELDKIATDNGHPDLFKEVNFSRKNNI